jgi:hypothetical protein
MEPNLFKNIKYGNCSVRRHLKSVTTELPHQVLVVQQATGGQLAVAAHPWKMRQSTKVPRNQ